MKGINGYYSGTKETWRGWKWNSIAHVALEYDDRIPPSERARRLSQKTVLYLVGPEDFDRKKAMAKGFANHNLIAIDLVQERVDEVRRNGGLAIRGSLQTVLLNWPSDWLIDVVDGDFCSGLVNDIGELPFCLHGCRGMHEKTVVSLNLMRGRDAHSNITRECLNNEVLVPSITRSLSECGTEIPAVDVIKHRGVNWLGHVATCWGQIRDLKAGVDPESVKDATGRYGTFLSDYEIYDLIRNVWLPKLRSYRSKESRQYFDSVVHRWGMLIIDQEGVSRQSWIHNRTAICNKLSKPAADDSGLRERIAALRAVRTKKLQSIGAV